MQKLNVEILMSHSVGLNNNYYRPTAQELLEDYLKAVPSLTINDFNAENLKEQQQALEQKQVEKDRELEQLRQEQRKMMKALKLVLLIATYRQHRC